MWRPAPASLPRRPPDCARPTSLPRLRIPDFPEVTPGVPEAGRRLEARGPAPRRSARAGFNPPLSTPGRPDDAPIPGGPGRRGPESGGPTPRLRARAGPHPSAVRRRGRLRTPAAPGHGRVRAQPPECRRDPRRRPGGDRPIARPGLRSSAHRPVRPMTPRVPVALVTAAPNAGGRAPCRGARAGLHPSAVPRRRHLRTPAAPGHGRVRAQAPECRRDRPRQPGGDRPIARPGLRSSAHRPVRPMTPRVPVALVAAARQRAARLPAGATGPASTPAPSVAAAVSGRRPLPVMTAFERSRQRAGAIPEDDPAGTARLPAPGFAPRHPARSTR